MKPMIVIMLAATATFISCTQSNRNNKTKKEAEPMDNQAQATFKIKGWEEHPFDEMEEGPKLTRAKVTKSYNGDIEGEGSVEYLMMHRPDTTASFVGLERVVGSLGGRSGSFVLRHIGTFEDGQATETISVVPGSGTGELSGLRGHGEFSAGHQQAYPITLYYHFED